MDNLIEEVKEINENNDIFGTYQKAKSICDFLELDTNKEILEKNNLIAIYGSWGSGKSCLMKTIYNNLNQEKFNVIWFNTWKYEKDDNLAYSLFKYIGKDNYWDKIKKQGSNFLSNAYGIFKSLTKGVEVNLGILNVKPGEMLDEAEKQDKIIKDNINKQKCLWEKVEEFENEFKNIKFKDNKRLVVFLDDLDRCESENIITLVSAIKLLLSINKNIIFIIGVDKKAVTLALENKYNNDYNKADEYLEKIFSITFELINNIQIKNFIKYINEIIGLDESDAQLILNFFEAIHFTNARHIKKVLRKYYLMKNYLKNKGIDINDVHNILLILYIVILNMYHSDEYKYIIRKDKEKIYENIILFYYDKNGMKKQGRYTSYKKFCDIKYNNGEQYNINGLLVRFSSYKIVNNEIRSMMYLSGEAHTDLANWLGAFEENNICNEFIKFIVSDSDNFKNLMKDHEFDDEKVMNLLNIVNDII